MSAALGNPSKLDCPRLHDISERDTLINASTIPRALPGAVCHNWAYSPPQSKAKYEPYLLVELCAKCLEGTTKRIDNNQGRSPRIDKAKYKPYLLVELCAKCLEGTTERSDGNRGRSPRIDKSRTMCLEGTTPEDKVKKIISCLTSASHTILFGAPSVTKTQSESSMSASCMPIFSGFASQKAAAYTASIPCPTTYTCA